MRVRSVVVMLLLSVGPWGTAAQPIASAATSAAPSGRLTHRVAEVRVIGHSVEGRPIRAYRKGSGDDEGEARRTVLVLGQMHGDETAGVATTRWLRQRAAVARDVTLWIVPTMNPDGLARGSRTNARGVDLNRNWPMNWRRGVRGTTWPGPRASSEPETRAMLRFLRLVKPDYVVSIHQPYGEVGYYRDKRRPFQRRLARALHLPLRGISIGGPTADPGPSAGGLQPGGSDNAPTLTGWYNAHFPGTALTVEYVAHPTARYISGFAGGAIVRATRIR